MFFITLIPTNIKNGDKMQAQKTNLENTSEKQPKTPSIGFDHNKYLEEQSKCILERVKDSKDKLYLEFGGKIIYDYHASRVLPGFAPDVKIQLLQKLKDQAEIILCIYAGDIERKKVRADFGYYIRY